MSSHEQTTNAMKDCSLANLVSVSTKVSSAMGKINVQEKIQTSWQKIAQCLHLLRTLNRLECH
jgi:hypothetical protein